MEKKGAREKGGVSSRVYNAVLEMDDELVVKAVKAEIDNGTDPSVILNEGLISAMDEIGKRFSEGTVFVPEMMMAAEAMKAGNKVTKTIDARHRYKEQWHHCYRHS